MKKKKKSEVVPFGLQDEKCPTEVVNPVNNGSPHAFRERKARHTREQTESKCLTKAYEAKKRKAYMDDFTSRNDASSRGLIESNKEKIQCFNNSQFDPSKTTIGADLAVFSHGEECQRYGSYEHHKKRHCYGSKTDPLNGPSKDCATFASCISGAFALDPLGPTDTTAPNKTSRKLLILDLNGILLDIVRIQNADQIHTMREHTHVSQKTAFKRPFCDDFLDFCFDVFDIGIWSSRMKHNVEVVVDYLMRDRKKRLLFCWDRAKCTDTGFDTVGKRGKPLVLKELRKLWDKEEPDLPWEKGAYSPTNTLLIDDSPSKALCNPPFTGIFPHSYRFTNEKDNSLGPGGDIRLFLEGLAQADNVQEYIEKNPFGQRSISDRDPSWKFYLRVIERVEKRKRNKKRGKKKNV